MALHSRERRRVLRPVNRENLQETLVKCGQIQLQILVMRPQNVLRRFL
jgi:hypothetical protein